MKFKFKDLRAGDVLKNITGECPGSTIKVSELYEFQLSAGAEGSFTKNYLEKHFDFVKRTKFEVGDIVRLVRSLKHPFCAHGWGSIMNKHELKRQTFNIHRFDCDLIVLYFEGMIGSTAVEPRHLMPVFENEAILEKRDMVKKLDLRITELEQTMKENEKELKSLKQAKRAIVTYM